MLNSAVIEEKKFKHSLRVRGTQPIRAKHFMSTGRPHHYGHLLQVTSDFIHIFSWFNKYVQPQIRGRQPQGTRGQNFDVKRNLLSLRSFATSLKKNQKKKLFVWFYTICFMILYMYISPGKGLTTPWRQNFDVNRNLLSLQSYVARIQKISMKSDFIQ